MKYAIRLKNGGIQNQSNDLESVLITARALLDWNLSGEVINVETMEVLSTFGD